MAAEHLSTVPCPECGGAVPAEDGLRQHEVIECPECVVELEVLTVGPVVLALAPEVEEDWGE